MKSYQGNAAQLAKRFGGHWGEHPVATVGEWQAAVAAGDTRLGYWSWVSQELTYQVQGTGDCWFIASPDDDGEFSRVSDEVWPDQAAADAALMAGTWTPA